MMPTLDIIVISRSIPKWEKYERYFKNLSLNVASVENLDDLIQMINFLDGDTPFRIWIHLEKYPNKPEPYFGTGIGIKLREAFQNIQCQFITRSTNKVQEIEGLKIYNVDELTKKFDLSTIVTNTRKTINTMEPSALPAGAISISSTESICTTEESRADLVIVTALHDDELENLKKDFNLESDSTTDSLKVLHHGQIKNKAGQSVKVLAASQSSTGMVEAAILATELITKYKPKYIAMTGVCGGNPANESIKLGDIIIAKALFLYQKGKITDEGFEPEIGQCTIDEKIIQLIEANKKHICRSIMDNDTSRTYDSKPLGAYIEPMACGTVVLNKTGGFAELISTIDRKAIAVDMESYSIARSSERVNDGMTKAIIIKSLMDHTQGKDDSAKKYAGYTSAQFLKYLVRDILIF